MFSNIVSWLSNLKKQLSILAGIAAVSLLATACGSTASTSASASTTAANKSHAPVTLTIMTWQPGGPAGWNQSISMFEKKYPWIKVVQDTVPYSEMTAKLAVDAKVHSGIDVFANQDAWQPYWNATLPLQGKIGNTLSTLNAAYAYCYNLNCKDGVAGLNSTQNGYPLYYNKVVFKKAGLNPAKPPTTWAQLTADCTAIMKSGNSCFAFGGGGITDYEILTAGLLFETVNATQAAAHATLAPGAQWTSPEYESLIKLFGYMASNKWFQPGMLSVHSVQAQDYFAANKAGFLPGLVSGAYNYPVLDKLMGGANVGITPWPAITSTSPIPGLPEGPGNGKLAIGNGTGYSVFKWTKHPASSILLVRFLVGPQVEQMWASSSQRFVSYNRINVGAVSSALDKINPAMGEQYKYFVTAAKQEATAAEPWLTIGGEYPAIETELQSLYLGHTSVQGAAQALESASESLLK